MGKLAQRVDRVRDLRTGGIERGKRAGEAPRLLEIAQFACPAKPSMKIGNVTLAQQTADFPHAKDDQRQSRQTRKHKTCHSGGRVPKKEILDETRKPKAKRERNEAASRGPEESGPGKNGVLGEAAFCLGFGGRGRKIMGCGECPGLCLIRVDAALNYWRSRNSVTAPVNRCAETKRARTGFWFNGHARSSYLFAKAPFLSRHLCPL